MRIGNYFTEYSSQWENGRGHTANASYECSKNEKWIDASDWCSRVTHMPRFARSFIYINLLRLQYTIDDINETRSFRSFFNLITLAPSHLLINRTETTCATHFIPHKNMKWLPDTLSALEMLNLPFEVDCYVLSGEMMEEKQTFNMNYNYSFCCYGVIFKQLHDCVVDARQQTSCV